MQILKPPVPKKVCQPRALSSVINSARFIEQLHCQIHTMIQKDDQFHCLFNNLCHYKNLSTYQLGVVLGQILGWIFEAELRLKQIITTNLIL